MGRGREGPAAAVSAAKKAEVVVVMVPFPAQGHLNQMLHLSRLLAEHGGVTVHFAGSATHNRQARVRLNSWELDTFVNIRFHDLPIPPFPSPKPDPNTSVKFPSHLQPSFEASLQLQAPLGSLLRSLSATSRRIAVVHDSLMSFAAEEASLIPNGEAYVFHSVSAFALLHYLWAARGKAGGGRSLAALPLLPIDGCFTAEFVDFIRQQYQRTPPPAGRLFNTCRDLEGEFVDLLTLEPSLRGKNYFALGPFNPVGLARSTRRHRPLLRWLDAQPPESVVYVSFGTTSSMPDRQIRELAAGLERSGQRFIWVLRDADRGDIFAAAGDGGGTEDRCQLPAGFEKRVADVGVVVRDWAPQLDILGHRSTALFLSHCGWNSCMESLSMGVPVAAWPMHSDQPRNALLLTELLKVGVPVQDWRRREETVPSAAVEAAIRRVMATGEGKEIRKRAQAVGATIRSSVSEGGASCDELQSLISYITR
ncbi:unnamed protein product [Spirodela intermedia]|uniref:Glycosyltransferase n=2 Tax=Spirodela intermedia TaxID=51605 RepID=A0A7I8IC43_SPIIN|nr:unnamed protein product [Spirodela intermedia]CAA6655388.1 unnamed protein product [Spirodela intermedia]CAA7390623.1 unnamed protein product [Spirodela intermedia]